MPLLIWMQKCKKLKYFKVEWKEWRGCFWWGNPPEQNNGTSNGWERQDRQQRGLLVLLLSLAKMPFTGCCSRPGFCNRRGRQYLKWLGDGVLLQFVGTVRKPLSTRQLDLLSYFKFITIRASLRSLGMCSLWDELVKLCFKFMSINILNFGRNVLCSWGFVYWVEMAFPFVGFYSIVVLQLISQPLSRWIKPCGVSRILMFEQDSDVWSRIIDSFWFKCMIFSQFKCTMANTLAYILVRRKLAEKSWRFRIASMFKK